MKGEERKILFAAIVLSVFISTPAFASHPIRANAVAVVDSSNSIIYAQNADEKLPPASTTKLLTAMVVLDRLDPDDMVAVSKNAARTHTVPPKLRSNETISVRDLLHLALMCSSNSAAVVLAEKAAGSENDFAEMMNEKAESIGAVNSRFATASGLPGGEQFTTAYDLTLILKSALQYPLIKEILGKKEGIVATSRRKLLVRSTDKLLWVTDNVIGGKTGYTCSAKHCFVGAIETENGTLYTAVMGAPSRSMMWLSTGVLMGLENDSAFKQLFAPKKVKRYAKKKTLKSKKLYANKKAAAPKKVYAKKKTVTPKKVYAKKTAPKAKARPASYTKKKTAPKKVAQKTNGRKTPNGG